MVSPTSQQTRVFEWMRSHLDSDGSVTLKDLTSMYTVINVVGHKARQLLSELSNSDINLQSFTYRVSMLLLYPTLGGNLSTYSEIPFFSNNYFFRN